ncbi:serine hydrolase domain-containing protein [Lacinutrix iliipiscaria]|uniref:Serine hydrolase domain-containing protein n=1 Tax=Lacinutrix iliipiscaria TaxID=1230532 RepID=A0ABW5WJD8_9FLAO
MKQRSELLAFIILLLFNCKSTTIKTKDLNPKVISTINQVIAENNIPGLTFSIIHKNGQTDNYAAGFSDIEKKITLKTDHTFFSGSIGKTYTAALLMQLIDKKQIELSDIFITYFPGHEWLHQIPNIDDITIGMLLQHTSGLPRYVLKPEIWKQIDEDPNKVWTYKDRLAVVFNDKPVHEAGKSWSYSDTNYILLGMLIEKVTKNNYYDLADYQILKPYNLNQTYPSLKRNIPNLAVGYSKMPPAFRVPEKTVEAGSYFFNPQLEWTGGGMASSTPNLAKWAKLYYSGTPFSKKTLATITTENHNGHHVIGTDSYGIGTFIYETKHGKAFGHSGFMPGFNSLFIYYPELEIAAAIQINCDYAASVINMNELMDDLISQSLIR